MSGPVDREVRADVHEVMVRYASGIDRREWSLLQSCFTDTCVADYGAIGVWSGARELAEWMRQVHEPCGHTMHRITNVDVRRAGDDIAARSYVDAIVMFSDNQSGTRAVGFYDDVLTHGDRGWQIARRTFTLVGLYLIPDGTPISLDG
jgi:3-phenylpropionate/cinnamic acid dioxygenase small subunit